MKRKFVNVPSIKEPIVKSPGFDKKDLSIYKLDIMGLCEFVCLYCSSTQGRYLMSHKEEFANLTEEQLGERIYPKDNPGLTFEWPDIIKNLESQLSKKKKSWGEGYTLVFSMLTDGFSPKLVKDGITEKALTLVLENTSFRIRVLTKNQIVGTKKWIEFFQKYPGRFVVGLSIGNLDDKWAKRVEIIVPPPSRRLKAYENLQAAGIPTFGMLCPVFPDVLDNDSLEDLIDKVNPSVVEEFWAEPYNDRKNWREVRKGYDEDSVTYNWFTEVFEQKNWDLLSKYQTDLYLRIRDKAAKEKWLHKLKFLLYEKDITPEDALRMERREGVLLQSPKDDEGFSKNPSIAKLQIPDKKIKKEVDALRRKVIKANNTFKTAWIELANNLRLLKDKMHEIGDNKLNWQMYCNVDSFSDYWESLGYRRAASYQMIESWKFIKEYRPKLLENYKTDKTLYVPSYTKLRTLTSKIVELNEDDKKEVIKDAFDEEVGREALKEKLNAYLSPSVIEEVTYVEVVPPIEGENILQYLEEVKEHLSSLVINNRKDDFERLFAEIEELFTNE